VAHVVTAAADGYDAGALGSVRPPAAIPPYFSRPFEANARVADEDGLQAGAEITLRIRYQGGDRQRDLLMKVRYNRAGGFENAGHNIWEV
jgi:hypothetical protein